MALQDASSVDELLQMTVDAHASDLHVECGASPRYRLYGKLTDMPFAELTTKSSRGLLEPLMDAYARKVYGSVGQWDMSYTLPSGNRFRVNIFKQKGAMSAVFRSLTDKVPDFDTLGLPITVFNLSSKRRGLVLVTGTTGSGKTTTLASLIDIINNTYYKHIITLEDPIEYLHWHARCNVSQREIGADVDTFEDGLRAALREDPDIILVGEMRDMETMQTALLAAETGHLVLSTLHTLDAVETINRVIDTFPESMHLQIRSQLVSTLEAVVSQQLLPRKDGKGYIVAYEILMKNRNVQHYIQEDDFLGLRDYMSSDEAKTDGMCLMDDTILNLYRKGSITRDVALDYAMDRKYISMNLR